MSAAVHFTEIPDVAPHDGETFKPHPAASHIFVSDEGRVWNSRTNRFLGYVRNPGTRPDGSRRTDQGYMALDFRVDGVRHFTSPAAMVLETFVGPRPADHDADHIDHNRLNNRLSNLRWRPTAENRSDVIR